MSSPAAPSQASPSSSTAAAKAAERGAALLPSKYPPFFQFGPIQLPASQVFHVSPSSYCSVNLRPLLPGHVLVVSRRVCARFADLSAEEVGDLWVTVQRVSRMLESRYPRTTSFTFAIQDGADSGQSVPHVHVHVVPRFPGDLERNDEIYRMLEKNAPAERAGGGGGSSSSEGAAAHFSARAQPQRLAMDVARPPRTAEQMASEAAEYRALFESAKL